MYAGLANHVERSSFADLADFPQSLFENFEEDPRIGGSRNQITGAASVGDISSLVSNQLCPIRAQNPKLETRCIAMNLIAAKKVILLANQLGAGVA
jgi:hypothetical protein